MVATRKEPAKPRLTARQEAFARLVVSGRTHGDAWKEAYRHPNSSAKTASEAGSRLANDPRVSARMDAIRKESVGDALLTVNDRLHLLAESARKPANTAAERSARARVIGVYTDLAGGAQPVQAEVTLKGDPNAPVVVAITVNKAPVRDRIAALRAAREARA